MINSRGAPAFSVAVAEEVLAAQAFNDLIGAAITRFDAGVAVLEVEIGDRHRQQVGLVHGGVLAYLVDNTLTFACGSVLGTDILTGGLTVTYLAAARAGVLRATAEVTAHAGRRAVATVTVDEIAPDGTVTTCAAGQGSAVAAKSGRTPAPAS
ncbi:PaaI family thioesterase [Gordonia crocea]|uniref:Putative phenylacetic acid degradation protein n=1 Tax=Gordonia crocea TaxID=589162 RepID=A0A7I9V1R3_9ACTN|nr:PaaI family thioesterase [Gordonia crocea]GED99010.1 putative phenylacetic acid degradation protein [Gordonia crocea]